MIALDLDNTIICYADAFAAAALEVGLKLPNDLPALGKEGVKTAALAEGGNTLWTQIQGLAYGKEIRAAQPYPGVLGFFARAATAAIPIVIVSHKTRYSAALPSIDLRAAASGWLATIGLTESTGIPVYFCDTREEKISVVERLGCRALLDDLPGVFLTPGFPSATQFILFDPDDNFADWDASPKVNSWDQASDLLLKHG